MRALLLVLTALLFAGCPPRSSGSDAGVPFVEGSFPAGFLWGVATAGFQVEAGCPTVPAAECEDRNSDWYQFVTDPTLRAADGLHLSGHDMSAAPGFYELYAQDIGRAKNELGSGAFRFGLEWSRIFPADTAGIEGHDALRAVANTDALDFYHDVIAKVREAGMKPLVTLNHYTLPLWIHDALGCNEDLDGCTKRGWLDERIVDELAKFSGFAAKEFGGEVDLWATQNEPLAVVLAGYVFPSETRSNPPGVSFQLQEARTVMARMQVAHARQYDAVKANDTGDADGDGNASMVGLVYNIAPAAPKNPDSVGDQIAAEDIHYLYNQAFLDGICKGDYDEDLDGTAVHREDMANRMDFLGVNYYTRVLVEASSDGQPAFPELSPRTAFNPLAVSQGADYAKGMYEALMFAKGYNLPIIITENGAADHDDNGRGSQFLVEHLSWLSRAIRDGADVRGYLWWTLTDNYEWNHGMNIRMGLFAVDKDDPQKARVARRTVAVYKRITDGNAIPADLLTQYPVEAH